MSRFVTLLSIPWLLFLLGATSDERPRLTFTGLGDVQVGMSSEAVKALGFKLDSSGPWDEIGDEYFVSCHYLENAPKYPGVALMMSEGKVVRIDIGYGEDKGWKSHSGATIGMAQADVKAMYGNWLTISGHPYLGDAGAYLRLNSGDGKYAMIFETAIEDMSGDEANDSKQEKYVTSFRSGLADAVSFIEGCA